MAVWKTSNPCSSGGAEGSSRRAAARCATAAAIPLAASETANSSRVNGTSCPSQVGALRSAVLRQKTAVMLAGSIPTKVGRPQKDLVQSEGPDAGSTRRVQRR